MEDAEIGTPRFVRRKVFTRTTRLCVVCLTPLEALSELGGWLVPQDYLCPKCGYRGYAYLEEAQKEEKDRTD